MPESAPPPRPSPPPRPGRAARAAWRTGWVLLALASMSVAYVLLVFGGR
jgi:hypothetical protein